MKIVDLKELDNVIFENEDERIVFEKAYSNYIKFFEGLNNTHVWTFNSDIALGTKLRAISQPIEANHLIWSDIYQSIHAAENLFYRRAHALFISSYQMLTSKDYLSASILARSLLEVCMWNIYHSVLFDKNTKAIKHSPNKSMIMPNDIEKMVLKLIWGTNEKNVVEEIKQHKVFKIFDQVSKAIKKTDAGAFKLEETYDLLSEFVHPNVEGNNVFIDVDINAQMKPVEEQKFLINFEQSSHKKNRPVVLILNTFIWCFSTIIFSSTKYSNTKQNLRKKFKLKRKQTPTTH